MKIQRISVVKIYIPADIYLLKVNNRNTRRNRCHSGVFIVNFEHILHLFLVFLLLTLNIVQEFFANTFFSLSFFFFIFS